MAATFPWGWGHFSLLIILYVLNSLAPFHHAAEVGHSAIGAEKRNISIKLTFFFPLFFFLFFFILFYNKNVKPCYFLHLWRAYLLS